MPEDTHVWRSWQGFSSNCYRWWWLARKVNCAYYGMGWLHSMHRQPEHVMAFLLAELGTSGSLDGQQRLVVKGRFAPKVFEGILRHYVSKFPATPSPMPYLLVQSIAVITLYCFCFFSGICYCLLTRLSWMRVCHRTKKVLVSWDTGDLYDCRWVCDVQWVQKSWHHLIQGKPLVFPSLWAGICLI